MAPFGKFDVIPESVNVKSIGLNQTELGKLFLLWSPVTNVNYGSVNYDVRIDSNDAIATVVIIARRIISYLKTK